MTAHVTGTPSGTVPAAPSPPPAPASQPSLSAPPAPARRGGLITAARHGNRTGGGALRAVPSAAPPVNLRPRADCTADSAGGLTFDVRLTECGTAAPPRTAGDAALLLRLRGCEGTADTVRLPLGPADDEGTLRAVLPSIMSLPEGRWDAYFVQGGEEPRRLLPGVHDLRSLIDRVPRAGRTWLGVRIPYATKYGNLTVRSWLRWPHAEAGPLRVADGGMVLRGRLYGARLSAEACLEAYPRDEAGAAPVSVPVLREEAEGGGHGAEGCGTDGCGTDGCGMDGCGMDGGDGAEGARAPEPPPGFTARLPLDALPSGPRVWNLWLRPSQHEEPVRLARILDDVPDKKHIFSYPPQRVTGPDGAACTVRPYYTLDNDLSVRVSCAEAV